ncbi:MAG: serine/threonine protein kinase, partial [Cyanobacteria bacterium]|nr:serine/threonine protein kinase [Cyanobacteriota bacterium]
MKKITDVEAVRRQIPPEILEKLSERYESFECISGGATSSVFKAHDKILSKPVALKVLLLSDTRELIRFQKEAQAASKLNHPNLMTAMDFNVTQDNRAYIVMDFVDGVSVEEWVKTEGELPMSAAIDIAKQIARGMSTAHQQGVVHRDLKTSNVMMSERGPKIHVTVI